MPPRRSPHRRADIEEWLDSKGVQYTFEPEVPLSQFDWDASLANQARIFKTLDEPTVDSYVEALSRGDKFPAVIAYWKDGKRVMVDGNHRGQSYKSVDAKTMPVYQIAKGTPAKTIVLMTFEANAKHGLPNTVEERLRHAIYLLDNGATQIATAQHLNLSTKAVQSAWTRYQADQRADAAGLLKHQWAAVPIASRQRLQSIRADETFEAMADLAIKAKLSSEEIAGHVGEINKIRSNKGQAEYVATLRDTYRKRVTENAAGTFTGRGQSGRQSQGPRHHLLIACGHLLAINIAGLGEEVHDAERDDIALKIMEAEEVLKGAREAVMGAAKTNA